MERALPFAAVCFMVVEVECARDLGIAFAYEAMTRAYTVAGQKAECKKYLELARTAGDQMKERQDKDYLFSELKTINC